VTNSNEIEQLHHREEVMGTIVTFDLYVRTSASRAAIYPQLARAKASLQRADAVFSTWKPNSPMSQLRSGDVTLAEVPRDIVDVLEACLKAKELTHGWFDPWSLPGGVDPTGYVKGWSAQRALDLLRDLPIVGAIVNAAGDIACFGSPDGQHPFRVGITDPFSKGQLSAIAELDGGAIATSGVAERGEHLFDPHAGTYRAGAQSATVTGPDLGLADALATAIAVCGDAGLELLYEIDDYEGFVISPDRSRIATPSFPFANDDGPGAATGA
jgi:thiamine biosynthesis lipoprotein